MRPKCFTAASAIACTAAASATSPIWTSALPPDSLDLARDGLGLGAVAARIDQDGRPAVRQRQRDRAADIAARAGDDRDLAGEFAVRHVRPLHVMAGHDRHQLRNTVRSILP